MVVELLHRLDQPEVALLDEVEQVQPAAGVLLGDAHHQAQVGLDELLLASLGLPLAALDLLLHAAQLDDAQPGLDGDLAELLLAVPRLAGPGWRAAGRARRAGPRACRARGCRARLSRISLSTSRAAEAGAMLQVVELGLDAVRAGQRALEPPDEPPTELETELQLGKKLDQRRTIALELLLGPDSRGARGSGRQTLQEPGVLRLQPGHLLDELDGARGGDLLVELLLVELLRLHYLSRAELTPPETLSGEQDLVPDEGRRQAATSPRASRASSIRRETSTSPSRVSSRTAAIFRM